MIDEDADGLVGQQIGHVGAGFEHGPDGFEAHAGALAGNAGRGRVTDGIRTRDPQDHNLVL